MSFEKLLLFTAAEQLMERVIYRTTYKNLYLFKKTLLETGQFVMAETVPVKLHTGNAASQESLVAETAVHPVDSEMVEDITSDLKLKCKLERPTVEVLLQGPAEVQEYPRETPIRTTHTR